MPLHGMNKIGFKEKYKENIYVFFVVQSIKALVVLIHYEYHSDLFMQSFTKRPVCISVSTCGTIPLTPAMYNKAPSE